LDYCETSSSCRGFFTSYIIYMGRCSLVASLNLEQYIVIYEKNSFPKSGIFVLRNKTNNIPNIMVKDFPNYTDKSILIVGCSLVCNKTATKHISKPMLIHNKVDNKQHLSLLDCFLYIYEQ